jgi:Primase C terminal 2 (PriCT-2)
LKLIQGVVLRRFAAHNPAYAVDGKTALDPACGKAAQPYYLPQASANPFVQAFDGQVFDVDKLLASVTANERKSVLGVGQEEHKIRPVSQTEENLRRCVQCLQAFSPDDEDDRWKSASALHNAFGDRAEPYWQEWYAKAERWTPEKAAKKWRDAATSPKIDIGYLFNRFSTARQAALVREGLRAGGFLYA